MRRGSSVGTVLGLHETGVQPALKQQTSRRGVKRAAGPDVRARSRTRWLIDYVLGGAVAVDLDLMRYWLRLLSLTLVPLVGNAGEIREAGWLQSIRLEPHRVRITAKLDTGAKSSSLHASEVERFTRNGIDRVRFSLFKEHAEQDGPKLTYDLPVKRIVKIKRNPGMPPEERVTVELSFCLDGEVMTSEFSLDNRVNLNYPALLGRTFMADRFVVDPSKTFVFGYDCPSEKTLD